jgi:hypothetical protein
MLSGKQKKIASKAGDPNKIDAKDFAVLKAEKAKGRGMGLQDEELPSGKMVKANDGEYVSRRKKLAGIDTIVETLKDSVTEKPKKKMGGGMIDPTMANYKSGGMTKGQKKVGRVIREFKAGKLHSGKKGPVVKNPKQAIAIALSEAGMSKKKMATGGSVMARGAHLGRTRPTKLC